MPQPNETGAEVHAFCQPRVLDKLDATAARAKQRGAGAAVTRTAIASTILELWANGHLRSHRGWLSEQRGGGSYGHSIAVKRSLEKADGVTDDDA